FGAISETFPGSELSETSFRRPPLLYTLYCVVYHRMFGMPGIQRSTVRKPLAKPDRASLRDAVLKLSEKIVAEEAAADLPAKFARFIAATQRGTQKLGPRKIRFDFLYDEAF